MAKKGCLVLAHLACRTLLSVSLSPIPVTGLPASRLQLLDHKRALRDHMGFSQEAPDPGNKARRTVPPPGSGSFSSAAWSSWHRRPSPSPSRCGWSCGWWQKDSQRLYLRCLCDLAQANIASTFELLPTRQCRLPKTVMRSTSSWLP